MVADWVDLVVGDILEAEDDFEYFVGLMVLVDQVDLDMEAVIFELQALVADLSVLDEAEVLLELLEMVGDLVGLDVLIDLEVQLDLVDLEAVLDDFDNWEEAVLEVQDDIDYLEVVVLGDIAEEGDWPFDLVDMVDAVGDLVDLVLEVADLGDNNLEGGHFFDLDFVNVEADSFVVDDK